MTGVENPTPPTRPWLPPKDTKFRRRLIYARHLLKRAFLIRRGYTLSTLGETSTGCTSVGGVLQTTILALLQFEKEYRSPVILTGGNELGHANGIYSHAGGYKVDLIDFYIGNDTFADGLFTFIRGHFADGPGRQVVQEDALQAVPIGHEGQRVG